MTVLSLAGRVLLVTILVWSAGVKLRPSGFSATVDMFRQLSLTRGARLLAGGLAGAELVVAMLVAVPATALVGTAAAAVLFALLASGVGVVLARRMVVRCACFGVAASTVGRVHLVRNIALLAGGASAFAATHNATHNAAPSPVSPVSPAAILVAAVLGVVLALILVRLEDLAFLLSFPARS